jgi:hypothetical protein
MITTHILQKTLRRENALPDGVLAARIGSTAVLEFRRIRPEKTVDSE